MENSGPNSEDDSVHQQKSQMGQLVQEEDFYEFVSNLSEENYKLLRDNNLLGTPGASPEEELMKGLWFIKENPPEHSGENKDTEPSTDEKSDDSLVEWLISSEQTQNVRSRHRENQPWGGASQIIPTRKNFVPNLQITVTNDINDGSPNLEDEYRLRARYSQEILENSPRQMEKPRSEPSFARPSRSEGSTNEAQMQVPPTRGQRRRRRSRSPDHRRTRARTESMSTPNSLRELFRRHHESVLSQTSEQPLVNKTQSPQAEETPRQQIPDCEFPNRGLLDSIAYRAQETSETANVTLENEEGRLRHMFSHSEQEDGRAHVSTIRSPGHRFFNTDLNDTASDVNQSRSLTEFSYSRNLIDSDSDIEPSVSRSIPVLERPVSPYARESADDTSSYSFSSYPRWDSSLISMVIYTSSSSCVPICDSSPRSCSSSSDASSVVFDDTDESGLSPGPPTEPFEQSTQMTPIFEESNPWLSTDLDPFLSSSRCSDASSVMFDDSDGSGLSPGPPTGPFEQSRQMTPIFEEINSWPSTELDHFILDDDDGSRGLTKAQIDNLPVRSFTKNCTETSCCICITDYEEGTQLRILPCFHSFHTYCIDCWLAEKCTCPICRREVAGAGER